MQISKKLSVVLPVYNEEENIDTIMNDLSFYFDQDIDLDYELIFIDKMWPDFDTKTLDNCIHTFNKRVRNYGV